MTGLADRAPTLKARRLRLHTQHEPVVIMRSDCHVCRSEGLAARSQVLLAAGDRAVQATLFQVDGDALLAPDEAALSEAAWTLLGVQEGDPIHVSHPPTLESLSSVRRRIHGHRLDAEAMAGIVRDVVAGRYSEIHLSAFLTATAAWPLDGDETSHLTQAMIEAGDRLSWNAPIVVDKHSIGGLPGNRTTPIVVAIVAALGLTMPKTSSRAITSPAGTADTMETLTKVDLDIPAMRRVVEAEGGCLAWGGAVRLSPADDIFIRVERVLDIDTEGQLIASVLSKKIAAGSTHVVLDIPVGPTAKVRSEEAGRALGERLVETASRFGLTAVCLQSDGSQPVGRGVGPALEALDVLAVLQNDPDAPDDLRRRACTLAGAVLELAGAAAEGDGFGAAAQALADGRAWSKFQRICEAQGGLRVPPAAALRRPLAATRSGRVVHINNRKVARLAKLAGAPDAKAAGLAVEVRLGQEIAAGDPLLTVHAQTPGELAYALDYAAANLDLVEIEA
ncbi:MAG: thymidine phosphorylase family protein [Brevundimonas sp.]|uniref:thymidine phosphorylase family protein n=1 Tax=Brevundimonas sp. TaxID=1871086 RepID=UPI0017BFDF86|nr:thymidine phosphorylase family protein [Brevundimonas sp.]MBA4804234.1 thymidine phosphorylase family protein [Brevundimonas sp.]